LAWLRSALDASDPAWDEALAALQNDPRPQGAIETK
jgi:hypothetical protein